MRDARPTRRTGLRAALALAALMIAAAVAVVFVGGSSGSSSADPALPPPPRSALAPKNVPLGPTPAALWAPVLATTAARTGPAEPTVAAEVPARTPEGTTNIVLIVGQTERRAGKLWVEVRVPGTPDDVRGWMPRSALGGYTPVRTRLVVNRERLRATLLRDGRPVFRAAIGVGAPATPTPSGDFYIRNQLHKYRSPFYGPVAFGTTARSANASDWPAGGWVGIHGTDLPELIPGQVSAGCIRMTNRDILRLARSMRVGTPVTIR
ncbi:MAG: L,D-transpeptidase [Thermoleophilaceae bacterium]|nr:L,D-transpeptidase [Thermoleophilaceae bacterium]